MINRIIAPINADIPQVRAPYKAICKQAVIDYKAALKAHDVPAMREIEGFFCSEFFRMVCGYGGKRVAKAIWERVKEEEETAASKASATLKRLNKTSI